jgi:hypothetical protein
VNGAPAPLLSLLGVAGVIEIITGALIVVGCATVTAAFIASGEMAAAYFIGHFPVRFWPIQTAANSPYFAASYFSTWQPVARESGASMAHKRADAGDRMAPYGLAEHVRLIYLSERIQNSHVIVTGGLTDERWI